jgi:hypothetical protein
MIVAGSASPLLLASAAGGYNLTNSLRFRGSASAYLNRTFTTPTDNKKWTWSAWVKLGTLSTGRILFCVDIDADNRAQLQFSSGNNLAFDQLNAGSFDGVTSTVAVYRDPSAWYHVVFVFDSANATASLRNRYYVNGVEQTYNDSVTIPQNTASKINSAVSHKIGRNTVTGAQFDGYMAEQHFIDGQALTPSSFGDNNASTGVWQPKKYAGTYGTNGFYLPFTDNSALTTSSNVGLGKDFSGNGNYWTTNNISITAGATYDSMTDVPTLTSATAANFCVMNPIDSAASTLPQYANLRLTNSNSTHSITRGTVGVTSGKYYWEIKVSSAMSNFYSGIATNQTDISTTTTVGADAYSWAYVGSNGEKRYNGTSTAYGSALVNGDVLGCALDLNSGKIWWSVNGTFQASGDPAAGTNEAFSGVTGVCFPAGGTYNMTIDYTFGQRPFTYTPPTGFVALNTFNLPTPTIGATASTQAGKYFNISLYTGTGSSQSITGLGFQPDWTWIKERNAAADHGLYDAVRGVQNQLESNTTTAETAEATGLTAFGSDGFTVGALAQLNTSGDTYVAWNWKANGAGSSNTAGSITSTVSANTSAGFSVVTYTGTGANATVGHGLGVAPSMIIVKRRNTAQSWPVYHASLGATKNLYLDLTDAAATATTPWNDTSPTSTVFSVGTSAATNSGSGTYVAYCFSEVAGYSKFGSYTGNGSTDGSFIFTGFRPKFVMIKRTDDAFGWYMYDTARNTYNVTNLLLLANASDAETTTTTAILDLVSNGFKLKNTSSGINASGGTYLYMAFAETPTKFSLAR